MTVKQMAKKVIDSLPDETNLDEIIHALYIKAKFDRGLRQIDEGKAIPHKEAKKRMKDEGWQMKEDSGRGWRRVVPSPIPKEIVELPGIKALLNDDIVVYAVGGGGIPVVANEAGELEGISGNFYGAIRV